MLKWITGLVLVLITLIVVLMFLPIGSPVPVEKTKWQKFSWGSMYVWTSHGGLAETPSGHDDYLLLEFSFDKSVMDKGCSLTVKRVHLKDPDTYVVLIDKIGSSLLMVELAADEGGMGDDNHLQRRLIRYVFELVPSDLPYDLNIELGFDCEGSQETYVFSQPLEATMVQPILGEQ